MIVKFSSPSERVKGLSFHPKKPWLLTGLHTGSIHLWDYRFQTVIEKYEGHEGPVRSVQFHPKLPLFASGGDDFTVRIWNYKTKKCTFLLKGHMDFVRCVNFHPDMPWVISTSDDQTARIWNYQSRTMIAILTGHSHYVMQAQFHPTQDLIITCSLDQTLRLWNSSGLVKKYSGKKQQDFTMSGAEVELIQIMEGHNAGVNWCAFHNDQPYIISAADDKKIKLWKYNSTRCWEYDQLTGHTNNVSSVVFHPKYDVIISNSEDKTTKVWGVVRKVELDSFTNKELDRFWVVAAHPDNYYFACGSDSALYVFTLFRDRVPCVMVNGQQLYYGVNKSIKVYDIKTNIEQTVKNLESMANITDNVLLDTVEAISANPYESGKVQLLIRLKAARGNEANAKHLLIIHNPKLSISQQPKDTKIFSGRSAVFVGKSKIVRVKDNQQIEVYNYETEQVHPLMPNPTEFLTESVHYFLGGKVLFCSDNLINVVDVQAKKVVAQTEFTSQIKKVVWQSDQQLFFAVICKQQITIFTKSLTKVTQVDEKFHIKSGQWLNSSIFIYSTKAQINYLLLNGDSGVIKSTENIIYIAHVSQTGQGKAKLVGMDCQANLQQQEIEVDEAIFKQALYERDIPTIQAYLKSHKQLGDSLIAYLQNKNYSALAINLVQDKQARFSLAINSNNLELAYLQAQELKDRTCYQQLAAEALRQGHCNIYEVSLQYLKEFDKLSYLYALDGNIDNLHMMAKIAQQRKNISSRLQNATFLHDNQERIRILDETGQQALGYLSANLNGLQEESEQLQQKIKDPKIISNILESMQYIKELNISPLTPLKPVNNLVAFNWPHKFIPEDELLVLAGSNEHQVLEQEIQQQKEFVIVSDTAPAPPKKKEPEEVDIDDDAKWGIDDDDLIDETPAPQQQSQPKEQNFDRAHFRLGITQFELTKLETSKTPSDLIKANNFVQSVKLLERDIPLKNKSELKRPARSIVHTTTQVIPQIPFLHVHEQHVKDDPQIEIVRGWIKQGYNLTTQGKFQETQNIFQRVLKWIPLVKFEQQELLANIQIARNYVTAMQLELAKKGQSPERTLELSCYMALCALQPAHRTLTLRAAMTLAYKSRNFVTAAIIAKRLLKFLEAAPQGASYAKPETIQNTKKVLAASEQNGTEALTINFEESLLYLDNATDKICANTYVLMKNYLSQCKYDLSKFSEPLAICNVCELCSVVNK